MTNKRPKMLIDSALNAAALRSFFKSIAVAMADEFAPKTTPVVT